MSITTTHFNCVGQTFTLTRQRVSGAHYLRLFRQDGYGLGYGTNAKPKEKGLEFTQTKVWIRNEIHAAARMMANATVAEGEFDSATKDQIEVHLCAASSLMRAHRFTLKGLLR
ncbi:MAG: hypothetical protein RSP_18170 [Rhodanobacter sp.]